jgi:hypothetical protein
MNTYMCTTAPSLPIHPCFVFAGLLFRNSKQQTGENDQPKTYAGTMGAHYWPAGDVLVWLVVEW